MLNFNQFVLISAELSQFTNTENIIRTNQLKLMLEQSGFYPVYMKKGVYKGSSEISFFVPISRKDDIERLEFIAFDRFNQESILVQYSDGHARLHYRDHIEHIGKLRQVTKEVAEKKGSYTFYPKQGTYYATV